MTDAPRVLVAGLGNVFLGDDAFGVELCRALGGFTLPGDVHVMEFGIRGYDLAYALTSGISAAILLDAVARGGAPGTLYVIEPAPPPLLAALEPDPSSALDAHAMDPLRVLAFAAALGALPPWLRIVGCEPASLGDADGQPAEGLSPVVRSALAPACEIVLRLIAEAPRAGVLPDA